MTNLFNSRPAWSPEGRNLLSASGWDGAEAEDNPATATDDFLSRVLARERAPMVALSAAYGDQMPVLKPGEVTEAPPVHPPASEVRQAPALASYPAADDDATEIARENAMEELPPFVSIDGREDYPYLKTMTGATLREIADIAKAQYPGATVRTGVTGRPIITMPPDATRLTVKPVSEWGDGGPLARESIGGREFQLDAPGVTLRDVANGGGQTAYKVGSALAEASRGAKAGMYSGFPGAAVAGALVGGADGYYRARERLQKLARGFSAGP